MQDNYKLTPGSIDALPPSVGSDTTSIVPGFIYTRNKKRGVPIPKVRNYFINKAGEVIKVHNGSEKFVPIYLKGKNRPFVRIGGKGECELIYLLIECFNIPYKPTDRISFKVADTGHIQISSIKITPTEKRTNSYRKISEKDERLIKRYSCNIKSFSANARGGGIISPYEILSSLKITDFKCFYCGCGISEVCWHLDHFIPMSKGGKNEFKNIVPSCPVCNFMKLDTSAEKFVEKCREIVRNFDNLKT